MDSRQRKGLEIAGQFPIKFEDGVWIVPSQTTKGKEYRIRFGPEETTSPPVRSVAQQKL